MVSLALLFNPSTMPLENCFFALNQFNINSRYERSVHALNRKDKPPFPQSREVPKTLNWRQEQRFNCGTSVDSAHVEGVSFSWNRSGGLLLGDHATVTDCVALQHEGTALEVGTPILVVPRLGSRGETRNDHQLATARRLEAKAPSKWVSQTVSIECSTAEAHGWQGDREAAWAALAVARQADPEATIVTYYQARLERKLGDRAAYQRLMNEVADASESDIGSRARGHLAFDHYEHGEYGEAIDRLKHEIVLCQICFDLTDESPCAICRDDRRDPSVICVVEEPADLVAIERSRAFRGRYHVLGGTLSPIDGVGPDELRIAELEARLKSGEVGEVILATNPSAEGDATAHQISTLLAGSGVKFSRIACGMPLGGDLEYADHVTISRSVQNRGPI